MRSPRRAWRALALVVGAVLALTGCKVDVVVGIDAEADGSGTVRVEVVVDEDVTKRIDLATQLQVDDLRRAGWTVEGPTPRSGGRTAVVATKPFRDPAGAAAAMTEVSGAEGPFRDFRLTRRSSFAKTTTEVAGTVDFTAKGLAAFGDPAVGQALGTGDLGIDEEAIEAQIGAPLASAFTVQVSVRLPGEVTSNAPAQAGNGATWRPQLTERIDVAAESTTYATARLAAVGALATTVLVGLVALLVLRVRRRRLR